MILAMTTYRKFADFYEGALPFQMSSIPKGGMCLSAFLVLWKDEVHSVLLGKLNKNFDWINLGALDKDSTSRISERWILPSSHLMLYENPRAAAKRVLNEQLGLGDEGIQGPQVFSEVYDAPRFEIKNHWDMEFVFTKQIKNTERVVHPAWNELKFLDVRNLRDDEFARNHQDVLGEAGLR